MAELADALVLGTSGYPCRFDPCYSHQDKLTDRQGVGLSIFIILTGVSL